MKVGLSFTALSSSLLLPVLLAFSSLTDHPCSSFSYSSPSLLPPVLKRVIQKRRRSVTQHTHPQTRNIPFVQTICHATLEHPSMSNSQNNNNMGGDNDEEEDDYTTADFNINDGETSEGTVASAVGTTNPQQKFNNHDNRRQWDGRKQRRNLNPAMGDTAFLRKRTDKVLALPSTATHPDSLGQDAISKGMKVDRKTFHFLIDSWAFSGEIDAAEQALALLDKMEELHQGGGAGSTESHHIRPDVRSYTKVINAISRSATTKAGDMAEDILQKMQELYQSGKNMAVKPNTFTYTAVVEAHANSGGMDAAQRAEDICEWMVQKYKEQDPDVRPTARSYNAAINAYAKSGAAQRADDLFRRMEDVYMSTGLEEVKPNNYNYNSLISAWANCGEEGAAQRAEEVLERMEDLYRAGDAEAKPTTVTFNAVIDAYSKSAGEEGYDDAGERAESILKHMKELYESGENVDAKPNVRSFNSVINVWAKSRHEDGAKRAEEILDQMKQLYEQGDKDVQPDVHSFSTVINAWARSQQENKADRALNRFKEMKKLYQSGNKNLRPNVVVANAVMNACAYTTGDAPERNRAVEIAHTMLKDLETSEYGNPDQVTYGTFIKVCSNQMPECDTRDQIVRILFQKCCKDGQVGSLVLQELRATTSPEKYYELVGKDVDSDHEMKDLPKEWWCNVVEGKWRRRRNF